MKRVWMATLVLSLATSSCAMPRLSSRNVIVSSDFALGGLIGLAVKYDVSQTRYHADVCINHLKNLQDKRREQLIDRIRKEKNHLNLAVAVSNIMRSGLYLLSRWHFGEYRLIDSRSYCTKIICSVALQSVAVNVYPLYRSAKLKSTIRQTGLEYNIPRQTPLWKKVFFKIRGITSLK